MNTTIKVLKGPDKVRLRPSVIFGGCGDDCAQNCVKLLLKVFLNEGVNGKSDGLSVKLCADKSVEIRSLDRGVIIDDTEVDGHPDWHYKFAELFPANRESGYVFLLESKKTNLFSNDDEASNFSYDVDGNFEVCCTQYASKFMTVAAKRDGKVKVLHFEKGYFVTDQHQVPEIEKGTYIKFQPDREVFGDYNLDAIDLKEFLLAAAVTIKNFKCELIDEVSNESVTFLFENGAIDYLKSAGGDNAKFYQSTIEAVGRERYNRPEYPAKLSVVVGFSKEDVRKAECFHNFRTLPSKAQHFETIKRKLVDLVSENLEVDVVWKQIEPFILLSVESYCPESMSVYSTCLKERVNNRLLNEMAEDIFLDGFNEFFKVVKPCLTEILK